MLNALAGAERKAGWQLLFNGTTESLHAHWRGFRQDSVPTGWHAGDGVLVFSPGLSKRSGDLITKKQFSGFELRLDWKISEGGNSGIFYNVSEDYKSIPASGPEYQILDAEHYAIDVSDVKKAGANYGLHAPAKDVAKPAGQWNEARIVVDGHHVEHWLNGEKVVEYEMGSSDWKRRVESSKFADWPGYAKSEKGHIALQDHGHQVWFRDIRIKPL